MDRHSVVFVEVATTAVRMVVVIAQCMRRMRGRVVRYRRLGLPGAESADLYVAHHGWYGGKRTGHANLREGSQYRMRLEPLEQHIDLETSCWIDTVGLGEEAYWATRVEALPPR